jgi:phosphoenolpyruvate phosphomutase
MPEENRERKPRMTLTRESRKSKSRTLRDLFEREGVIRLVGAHDGLSARLVELNGFDGVWASGLEISASHTVPDANILTMTQYLEASSVMNYAISIPVVADCDTGYGNSSNVMHMVHKYEAAGIAAVTIEDKKFPKVNSYIPGRQELAPVAEFVGKILAAKNAQQSDDFMVIARTEALIAGWGQEEALRRAHAYVDAGADAILIHSKASTPGEIVAFTEAWDFSAPLVIVPTTYPTLSIEEANRLGIKMVIYANQGLRASIRAMDEVFSEIMREGRLETVEDKITPMTTVFELQGMTRMREEEKIYLRSGEEPISVIIPAAGAPRCQSSMEHLLMDVPLAMLDINGKPLLQRSVETLHRSRLRDISVVTGYRRDSIKVDGVNYIDNPKFDSEHIMTSIMCAEDEIEGRTLIIYSDILFENSLVEKLKSIEADFLIVVDNSFDRSRNNRNKKLDLVITREALPNGDRSLNFDHLYTVERIGSEVPEHARSAEFIGITMLSAKGSEVFKREYHRALAEYRGHPFFAARNICQAGLVDFLNYLIQLGHPVKALQTNWGWAEIHTFDNYKYACSITKGL